MHSDKPSIESRLHLTTKPGEIIPYSKESIKSIHTDFERKQGESGLICINKSLIDKQTAVLSYMMKNIGLNLIKGKSVMNVSFPINIFDTRSLLEV